MLRGGDPNRGHELFLERLGCTACHRIGKTGGLTGPDLSKIGAIRSGRDILESIVFPSSTIAQGYDAYSVKLHDGTEISGVWFRQTAGNGLLRAPSGLEIPLQPDQIEKMERLKVSLMPEGLLTGLKEIDISNLLAYLQSLK